MLEDVAGSVSGAGWKKASSAPAPAGRREERRTLIEQRGVAGHLEVVRGDERQPAAVVGDPRAEALTGRREPPVLHVAGRELAAAPRGRGARARGPGGRRTTPSRPGAGRGTHRPRWPDRTPIVPTRGTRAPGTAARVEQEIHRPIGRADLHRAQHAVPQRATSSTSANTPSRSTARYLPTSALRRGVRGLGVANSARPARPRRPGRRASRVRNAPHGSRPAPTRPSSAPPLAAGAGDRAAAAEELRPIAGERGLAAPEVHERDPVAVLGAPGVAGEQGPGRGVGSTSPRRARTRCRWVPAPTRRTR